MITARIGPSKGSDSYAAETVKKMVERLGRRKIIMRSDNEPAILALKEAVSRERVVEIELEEVPVGDHQAKGLIENAIKNAQGQLRAIEDAWREDTGDE
jgi:hypothetical protein